MELENKLVGPLSILLAAILGVGTGVFFPEFTESIEGIESVLSNLLRMCVIPIVVSSLIVEIVSFLRSAKPGNIKKFIFLSLVISVFFVVVPTVFSLVMQPGKHTTFSPGSTMAKKIAEASIVERSMDEPIEKENKENFFDFFSKIVPQNIFHSLNESKTLQIIFFTIVFSIALSTIPESNVLQSFFQETRHSFLKIFEYALKFLPVLIFTSTSLAVSKVGLQVFLDMRFFLGALAAQLVLIFIINMGVLHYRLRESVGSLFKKLETSLLVAFSGSPLAATLPALDFFKKTGHADKQFVSVIGPISMFMNRFSSILYFCAASLFIGHIYGFEFTFDQILFLMALSIAGGIAASAGTEGIKSAVLLSILDPLNLPAGQIVLVLASLDFLISPFLSIITVQTNITLLSFLLPRTKKS